MEFRIKTVPVPMVTKLGPNVRKVVAEPKLVWELVASSGYAYCRSAVEFDTEKEARSSIAEFKRVAGAMRYTKTVVR